MPSSSGAPDRQPPQPQPHTPPAVAERQRRQAVSNAALDVPDLVRLQLDAAIFGDRSPHGSTGPDGVPRVAA